MRVTVDGRDYSLPKRELIIKLRGPDHRMVLQDIADIVGISRQAVSQIVQHHAPNLSGVREYPELEDEKTYEGKTDEQVALELGITEYKVQQVRRKLGVRRRSVNLSTRQKRFVRAIFGKGHVVGASFEENLTHLLKEHLSERAVSHLISFYIKGILDDPYSRVQRHYARKALKKAAAKGELRSEALRLGVIKEGSSGKK